MRRVSLIWIIFWTTFSPLLGSSSAQAALMATATLSTNQTSAPFNYTLTLHNTGTTNIGSFWFAWIPGEDFLPTTPTGLVKPANWFAFLNGGGAMDGHSIEFIDNGTLLAPGASLTGFGFTSNDSPTKLAGKSPFYTSTPAGTSFVYGGAPLSDAGYQFTVSVVPEPPSLALAAIGGLLSWTALRKRTRADARSWRIAMLGRSRSERRSV